MANARQAFDFIARGAPVGAARQLIVLLHGYGRSAALMEKMAQAIIEKMPDARIIMPQAPDIMRRPDNDDGNLLKVPGDVREADGQDERQWFDIKGDADALRRRIAPIAARMNDFIDNQRDVLGLRDQDIAIMGFSQGGGVALYTALTRAAPVRCVVGHSTIFLGAAQFQSRPPIMFIYGGADPEFSQTMFTATAKALGQFTDKLHVERVDDLAHTTNRISRERVARYIAAAFKP